MANPIVVEFMLKGMPDVARALRSIEQATAAADRARTSNAQRASAQRSRVEEQEAKMKIRAMLKADAEQRRAQDRATREVEKRAKQKTRAEEQAAKAEVRAAEKSANEKIRIARQVDREIARLEKQRARESSRIERERARENAAIQRESNREQDKIHRQQSRGFEKQGRDRDRFNRGIGNKLHGAAKSGLSTAAGLATRGFEMFGQLGGGFSIADSVQREVELNKMAGKISASTVNTDGAPRASTKEILSSAKAMGLAAGIDPKEVLEGIDQFKNLTGDTNRAMAIMPKIAELATAFGADSGELAQNAGNIALSDPNMSNEDVMRLLRVQTRQGAVGAVELADMAKFGGRLAAGASLFEGDRSTNIASMGAFAQIARQRGGAATAAEASMGAQRFATDVAAKADVLKDMGIDVKGEGGKLKDPREILKAMVEKTGGDVTKFKNTGLGDRGVKVLTAASDIYSSAGGGAKGMKALDEELKKFTDGVSEAEVTMRAQARLQDADKELERSLIELRTAVGTELLPEFLKMVPVLREALPTITKLLAGMTQLADWAMRNPLSGLATLIGASFAREMTNAAIGKVFESVLASNLGRNGLAVGSAVMAIAMAKMAIEQEFKTEADAQKGAVEHQLEAANLMAKINRGEGTAADTARMQELRKKMEGDVAQQIATRENPGFWKTASAATANVIAPGAAKEAAEAEERNRQQTIADLNDTMKKLATAIDKNTKKQGDAAGGGSATTGTGGRPAAASNGIVQRTQ